MNVLNQSPFTADTVLMLSPKGEETLAVLVKASYDLGGPKPRPSEKQEAIQDADEYVGEPGASSIRLASDRLLHKTATDVILVGSAYPRRTGHALVDVVLQIGPIHKVVRVFGDRVWKRSFLLRASKPEPFDRMPLVYERAFGGIDDTVDECFAPNPIGIGFRGKRSQLPVVGEPLPNMEDPKHPIDGPTDRPPLSGFGVICPSWAPRIEYAGTYDEDWLANRAPLPPTDYDPRFQQVAPPDQICQGFLKGGEPVEVQNASARGHLAFCLPRPTIDVSVQGFDDSTPLPVHLDTVVIDGDRERLLLTYRGSTPVHGRVYEIDFITVSAEGVE